jgi:hypothetical protein
MPNRTDLLERKAELECELEKTRLQLLVPSEEIVRTETQALEQDAKRVITWLAVLLTLSMIASLVIFLSYPDQKWQPWVMSILVGFLGSCGSALVSANARFAAGLEFSDGTQHPDQGGKKERFNARLASGFLDRPLLGAFTGFLAAACLKVGLFGGGKFDEDAFLLAFCLLSGLFAKTFIDRIKEIFKSIIGAK